MSAAVARFQITAERESVAAAGRDLFAPDVPMVWWCGRLRYVDEKAAPPQLRFRERLRRVWHDRLRTPATGPEERPVFPDLRGSYGSRPEAHAWCPVGDPMAFVLGFPFGQVPFGDEVFDTPTFCRPYFDGARGREKDRVDAERYADADLRAFLCSQLFAENVQLRSELNGLAATASRVTRTCDEV